MHVRVRITHLCSNGNISEHPIDMEAVPDEWVQFNCTVNCNYIVCWFIAGYSSPMKRNNNVPGLVIRRTFSRCTSSNYMLFFFILIITAGNTSKCTSPRSSQNAHTCLHYCAELLSTQNGDLFLQLSLLLIFLFPVHCLHAKLHVCTLTGENCNHE